MENESTEHKLFFNVMTRTRAKSSREPQKMLSKARRQNISEVGPDKKPTRRGRNQFQAALLADELKAAAKKLYVINNANPRHLNRFCELSPAIFSLDGAVASDQRGSSVYCVIVTTQLWQKSLHQHWSYRLTSYIIRLYVFIICIDRLYSYRYDVERTIHLYYPLNKLNLSF